MKKLAFALVIIGVCGVMFADEERTFIVPKDDKSFVIGETDFVRLAGKGIAGSIIVSKIEGPAKIAAINNVRELSNGVPMIGNTIKEFDLKPTGKGKVQVTITVTSPIPNSKPEVRKIEFEIK